MQVSPNTELAAVNRILFTIGASPVSTLSDTNMDVVGARTQLAYASAKVQAMGWTFNTLTQTLQPDAFTKKIVWRQNWLKVLVDAEETMYINRNGFLYNRDTNTDQFTANVVLEVVENRPFDELPFCFQTYAAAAAALAFNNGAFGDPNTAQTVLHEQAAAWAECQTYELEYGNYGIFEDTYVQGRLSRR